MRYLKLHIVKTITWRVLATLDTILISFLITNNLGVGIKIGFFELLTKISLYFLHERLWMKITIVCDTSYKIRHLLKTISWRLIGRIDTILIAWFINGNIVLGLSIGAFELISKSALYYIHERIWYRTKFGK